MALVEVKVPDIGDFKDVQIIEMLVKVGDTVKAEQSLFTVESDKASMEIPSSHGGVIKELKVKLGDSVNKGSLVMFLETIGAEIAAPGVAGPAATAAPSNALGATSTPAPQPVSSAASAASLHGTVIEVMVPDIGDFQEVTVIEVFVKAGDSVKLEQSLITVESDKASMEIPSSHAGIIKELRVKLGDKISKGVPLALIEAVNETLVSPPAPSVVTTSSTSTLGHSVAAINTTQATSLAAPRTSPTATLAPHNPIERSGVLPHASPTIRKLARELGVPLPEVKGSGHKGRITQQDVHDFVKAVMSAQVQTAAQTAKAPAAGMGSGLSGLLAWPQVDFAKFGPVERKDLSRIKKISGANLHRNWVIIPHVTNHDDADITELEALRVQLNKENEKSGTKVTMLAFLIKASVAALKKFPEFNASLDGDQIVFKQYFHVGFAADTPNGLMVPVIKDADKKGVFQISQEMGELAKKAREGKLNPAEMTGGCFSISSLGGIGGRYFTPIINAPEVAILGVCKSAMEPQWDGNSFQPRLMLPLSLSWDHRVIDGAAAARFNAYLCQILSDFRRVML
jgi:pyruvate dehydrogenase E2 component (dihydrolipoamide acetyltransferase)